MSTYKTGHGFTGCISGIFPQPLLTWTLMGNTKGHAVTMLEDDDGTFTVISKITTTNSHAMYTSVGLSGTGGGETKDTAWSTLDERRMYDM